MIRLSNILKALRTCGDAKAADHIQGEADRVGRHCQVHGDLADPAVFVLKGMPKDRDIAFVCPHCSDPRILAEWEAEPAAEDHRGDA